MFLKYYVNGKVTSSAPNEFHDFLVILGEC